MRASREVCRDAETLQLQRGWGPLVLGVPRGGGHAVLEQRGPPRLLWCSLLGAHTVQGISGDLSLPAQHQATQLPPTPPAHGQAHTVLASPVAGAQCPSPDTGAAARGCPAPPGVPSGHSCVTPICPSSKLHCAGLAGWEIPLS